METALEDCDRGLLFGQDVPASHFSGDNAGRMFDHVYETGTQRIFSQLSLVALERFGIQKQHIHFDTSSVNLYGDYRGAEDEEAPFRITHGDSKDKRPDLKQFVLSLHTRDG